MSDESDYIVLRRHPDLPADFNTGDLDGKWFDRNRLNRASELHTSYFQGEEISWGIAGPTGRFETREDGAVAEVWEITPQIWQGADLNR